MVADNWPQERLHLSTTSGSTGTPLRFYGTREDQFDHGFARSIRALEWAGLRLGDRTALIGRPRLPGGGRHGILQSAGQHAQRFLPVYVDTLSNEAMPGVIKRLAEARLDGIWAYPNAVALIAGFIRDTGVPAPVVKSIVTGGEELLSHERRVVREVFGTEPYSKYSSFEAFDIACECGAHEGLHIAAEDILLEVVDDAGTLLPPGTEGRIVVTNLHNYGMPFIRYDLGDSGSLMTGTCSCKRTLPRLGSLVGRKNRFLVTRSGARVFPGTLFLDQLAGLGMRQYQIVQETVDEVVMRLVPSPDASSTTGRASLERSVLEIFRSGFGPELALRVEFVDHIEPSDAGKHVFMLSRMPNAGI
jgi:phenylacetate-CoA ligase